MHKTMKQKEQTKIGRPFVYSAEDRKSVGVLGLSPDKRDILKNLRKTIIKKMKELDVQPNIIYSEELFNLYVSPVGMVFKYPIETDVPLPYNTMKAYMVTMKDRDKHLFYRVKGDRKLQYSLPHFKMVEVAKDNLNQRFETYLQDTLGLIEALV